VTLVSRSTGLGTPEKEEGNTEYEVGDVDADGHLDLVSVGDHGSPYVNSDQHGIMVWLGVGAGTWTVHQFASFGYGGCALGDLDLDGHLDVAWGIHHNWGSGMSGRLMGAARGDGTGQNWTDWGEGLASSGETWGMFATALADFDLNGRLDVVSQSFGGSNGLRLYENLGDGTWSQAWALTGGSVGYTIETCDVDADGHPDIVSTRQGTIVLLGDGAFGFTPAVTGIPAGTIRGIEAGDMNGDGCDDLVFALGSSGLRCLAWDDGAGQWVDRSSGLPASGTWDRTQFGDIDGDGHLDVVAYREPTGQVFLGDGTGSWTADASWTMPSPGDVSALRVDGDVDHDGREDIVIVADMSGFPFYRNQLRVYSPWSEPAALTARVTAPHGGETLIAGSIRDVRWLAAVPVAHGPATVDLELSMDGAGGPWTPIANGLPNSGRHQWLVTAPGASSTCRVRATITTAMGSVSAISAADFTIDGATTAVGGDGGAGAGSGDAVDDGPATLPPGLSLSPNPARHAVTIRVDGGLPSGASGRVALYDVTGRRMRDVPLASAFPPGAPGPGADLVVELPLVDSAGSALAPGVYFVRLQAAGVRRTARFVHVGP
jgi:hypothetical protein